MRVPKVSFKSLPQRYPLTFLTSALLVGLSSQPSSAFTVTQPSASNFDAVEGYTLSGNPYVAFLNPITVEPTIRGGTPELLNLLNTQFQPNGWTFQPAANDLQGSFNVTLYDAVGTNSQVGTNFSLEYAPQGSDPQTGGDIELHWIQRVFNNHNITNNPGHGNAENVIDVINPSQSFTNPGRLFYDFDVNFATPPHFEDGTRRPDPAQTHNWSAELYLASLNKNQPKTVTIYNGVRWGWENVISTTVSSSGTITSGTFVNPQLASSSATVAGEGTNDIAWGIPTPGGDSSELIFNRNNSFSANLGEPFTIGTVTYHNGSIQINPDTGITAVDLLLQGSYSIPSLGANGLVLRDTRNIMTVTTPNTNDPLASADFLSISAAPGLGIGNVFHVLEGNTATATLLGRIIQTSRNSSSLESDNASPLPDPLPPIGLPTEQEFAFELLGFGEVTSGEGFITTTSVPEPSTIIGTALGLGLGALLRKQKKAEQTD